MVEEKPTIKDKLMLKILIKRMKNKKKKMLKKKHEEAIQLAKQSILSCTEFMYIEDEGKEIDKSYILNMSNEKTIELFDMLVQQLEDTYLGRAKV